jgi:hypothetical protein
VVVVPNPIMSIMAVKNIANVVFTLVFFMKLEDVATFILWER